MKKILLLIFLFPLFLACDKDDDNNIIEKDPDECHVNYYVKYVISASYPRIFSDWSVSTPQGQYTKSGYQTRHWEETYGPVKKGFNCNVKVKNGEPTIAIYIAKNQEPFALKVTKNGHSASYTVD